MRADKLGYARHCYGSAKRLIEAQNSGSVRAATSMSGHAA